MADTRIREGQEADKVLSTDRQCPVSLHNRTGKSVQKVKVRFTHTDRPQSEWTGDMKVDEKVDPIFIAYYRTGDWRHDYWFIEFYVDGKRYACKDNFYCDLTADDDGKTVALNFTMDNLHVGAPSSSSCDVAITQR